MRNHVFGRTLAALLLTALLALLLAPPAPAQVVTYDRSVLSRYTTVGSDTLIINKKRFVSNVLSGLLTYGSDSRHKHKWTAGYFGVDFLTLQTDTVAVYMLPVYNGSSGDTASAYCDTLTFNSISADTTWYFQDFSPTFYPEQFRLIVQYAPGGLESADSTYADTSRLRGMECTIWGPAD